MNLSINNVISISVSQTGQGIGQYNTSNIAIFSNENYANSFGTDGFKIYLSPIDVATDFGTDSRTYKMGLKVFSQQPNILANNGYLVVIPQTREIQHIGFSLTPTTGTFVFNYDGHASAAINWNDTATQVQTKLRAIVGLSEVIVTGAITSGSGLDINYAGVQDDIALATITSNTLVATATPVVATVTQSTGGESLAAAITRTVELVEYFGILSTNVLSEDDTLDAAEVVQALNKILFVSQYDTDTVESGGIIDLITTSNYNQTRGLFYGATDTDDDDKETTSLLEGASYAGRALSTNFNGSLTTQTMHLKDLIGVAPDPSMDQTLLQKCKDAGADVYASFQGVPKVFCSGANDFFDNVYNLLWFVGALKVAGFNVLAQTSTKIPQTETGISVLKSAYRQVCELAVSNGYLAPGSWTSPTTFGVQADLLANILQRGYYIYSQPVSQQLPADRQARKAPLIQIAIKLAGAVHESSVIVYVND